MKNVLSLIENRRRNALIERFEKSIYALNEYTEKSEFVSEALVFARNNAPIVLMNLKNANWGLRESEIRENVIEWAKTVINGGKEAVSSENLISSIKELDETIQLRYAEYFAIKDIFTVLAAEVFEDALSDALSVQKKQHQSEIWLNKKGARAESDDVYFLEHALKLSRDMDKKEKQDALLKQIEYIGKTEDDIIEIYSKTISELLLKFTNSVNVIHLVNNFDWMEAFETLSITEKILRDDPGDVYPYMDDASKSAVRRSIEEMSVHSGFSENSISSIAALLVKEGRFSDITQALYTDHGREAVLQRLNPDIHPISKMTPDSSGRKLICVQISLTGFLFMLSLTVFPPIACIFLFPVFWSIVSDVFRFFVSKCVKTYPLLSMDLTHVPDECRTLVVIPALLTTKENAEKIVSRLNEHGVHQKDQNIDFLLLGDFKDSENETNGADKEIEDTVNERIKLLNMEAGRRKYFYLQRTRTFNESDQMWMGRERKRGAIEDLNRLIVTGENRFSNAEEIKEHFFGRYTYLLTMDSDTRILPGEIRKLIGMISHPLNRDISVIQPRMETIHAQRRNIFAQCLSGIGGTDHYDICAGDFYQDLTGKGLFSGKGILRIRSFYDKTLEAFQENTVLSHDMIEGILTGSAYAGNRVMFETFPDNIGGFLKRLDRWTRGDWQLIHYLFGRIRLDALGRFKILSNLVRSLKNISVISGITASFWFGDLTLFALSLLAHFLPVFLNGIGAVLPSIMSFVLLPSIAYTEVHAAITAVIRLYITKRKRLEWVTAAENVCCSNGVNLPGIFASLLLIPGLFQIKTVLIALLIGGAFAFGKPLIEFLNRATADDSLSASDYGFLSNLSKSIWKFFEKYVPINGNGLPPDNVQLDPAVGIQKRTSPTNIGMYMLSVIGADELGLIDKNEAVIRLGRTLESLKKLEKYNGLFYNWYDINEMKPVYPRYISSVDLGNLMAACISARNYLKETEKELSDEFQKIMDEMDIAFLYNRKRKLFRIGYDVENERLSNSHYDLFASEARILSYAAMAEKGIELKHWKHLGRPSAILYRKPVILSWSGTMFEYMMPNLLLPSSSGCMAKNTEKTVVQIQKRSGKSGIWGISESAYKAFDRDLNYQYQAFGISDLALSGESDGKVYSPYSVFLSLEHSRESGVQCLQAMSEMGLKGDFGFYEAADFTKDEQAQIIYSYMTHHQGMSFVSLVNLLTGNKMKELFVKDPKEAALLPLLSEKPIYIPFKNLLFSKKKESVYHGNETSSFAKSGDYMRYANKTLHEGHILFGGGAFAYFEPLGRSFYRKDGIYANRYSVDVSDTDCTLLPKIMDKSGQAEIRKCIFDTGFVKYELSSQFLTAEISFTLNPENGCLLIKTEIHSNTKDEIPVTVDHDFELALSDEESMYAHPVFADLFVREEKIDSSGKRYLRKDRNTLRENLCLYHLTDNDANEPEEKEKRHAKHARLIRNIALEPFRKKEVYFEIGIDHEKREIESAIAKSDFDRACIMLRAQINAHIQFCGLKPFEYRQADRNTSNLYSLYAKEGKERIDPTCLWPLGISGDAPILLSYVAQKSSLAALKKLIRAHEFYRYAGLTLPLVVLHLREADYFTPLSDAIHQILASSHLSDGNGAYVFSEDEINENQKLALNGLSVILVKNDFLKDTVAQRFDTVSSKSMDEAEITESEETDILLEENGYGGFLPDDVGYRIRVTPDNRPPRRWSNFLAKADFGAMTNDLGIAHVYCGNSRMGRITPFQNNLDFPKPGIELSAIENGKHLSLTPGLTPKGVYRVTFRPCETTYFVETVNAKYETTCFLDAVHPVLYIRIEATAKKNTEIAYSPYVHYLMGTDIRDLRFTRIENGCAHGKCNFAARSAFVNNDKVLLVEGNKHVAAFALTVHDGSEPCEFFPENIDQALHESRKFVDELMKAITVDTKNPARDAIVNGFMKAQTLYARFHARFGPYQPGGAFGMRDQLQDLLSIMYFDLKITRKHLLLCASRQFEKGDALHWWHMPSNGVRTRISDDILFLPFIASKYIELSGDTEILDEHVSFLKDVPIPDDQEDLYRTFEETEYKASFYDHIMRAFRHVNRRGSHNLILMGSGDWNDGMNRVGHKGKGESVWLSEFFICCANEFLPYAGQKDKEYLVSESETLKEAIEQSAWDGEWYIRAFDDEGRKLGSKECTECKIDLITQTWAVIAGLDKERAKKAIKSAEDYLINGEMGYIRLLTPPFSGKTLHPGYISAYPEGVRENGGQYTHAACWLVKAYAILGMADEAWKAFDMLLPLNRTNTKEKADAYGGEPYVIAADISDNPSSKGACGWTWYTGAAAWAERVLIEDILGVTIKEDTVSMHALLPKEADSMSIRIKRGKSIYTLTAKRDSNEQVRFIHLIDDGLTHKIEFPIRG